VSYMIKTKIMKHHGIPVIISKFFWDMSSNIIVHFSEILMKYIQLYAMYNYIILTDRNKET
jgi:hypothetical protein